jgi:hypothetical protein
MSGVLNLLLAGAASAIKDAYFNLTTLLLNTSSTNGAQNNTFLDSSTNNFTITRNGNTTQGTFTPFSQTGWSNYFSASPFLSVASNSAFDFGSGDATQEMWIYPTAASQTGGLFDKRSTGSNYSQFPQITIESGVLKVYVSYTGSSWAVQITGATPTPNTWTHIALVRSGNTWTLYVNGAVSGTPVTASGSVYASSNSLCIGAAATDGGNPYTGYISNVRIVKGTAVYTSAFTPSTTPLTAISGTSLLTCQSNRFLDASSNAFAITLNSTVSVQAFSPFAPTAAYDPAVVGGSGYFDASGDYLTAPNNAAFNLGSNNFTIECWFYQTASSSSGSFISQWQSANDPNSSWQLMASDGSTSTPTFTFNVSTPTTITSSSTYSLNCWNHIAAVRNGSTVTLYLNGASVGSSSIAGSIRSVTNPVGIATRGGSAGNLNFTNGYIFGARVVNGTAVYTTNFTPPTAPPTAITNTVLLLSATNSGIFDSTAKNDLETVGNAQVSTTQAKWGTTSMAFDGTGDALFMPSTATTRFGAGNWTIEFWFRTTTATTRQIMLCWNAIATNYGACNINFLANGKIGLQISETGSSWKFDDTSTGLGSALSANTWYYLAVTRSGATVTVYIDGSSIGTYTLTSATSSLMTNDTRNVVGSSADLTNQPFNGYIDDIRVTNGVARTITTPTAAFPTQ